MLDRRFSVAPMMEWTTSAQRQFMRLFSPHALLYTEMVTSAALKHGDVPRHLNFAQIERPLALQLGGSDPEEMAQAASLAQQWGYDEVNINVGCPSDRVQAGRFGACLMAEPQTVAACVRAMRRACDVPVTVKTRIGIDRQDAYEPFRDFIDQVAQSGCEVFVVHARKAWLDGLSPKENREIPPLRYEYVARLKQQRPDLQVVLNGGLTELSACDAALAKGLDGVMVGRTAYQQPRLLAQMEQAWYGTQAATEAQLQAQILALMQNLQAQGQPAWSLCRHILGLYHARPGGRRFRRVLSTLGPRATDGVAVLQEAFAALNAVD